MSRRIFSDRGVMEHLKGFLCLQIYGETLEIPQFGDIRYDSNAIIGAVNIDFIAFLISRLTDVETGDEGRDEQKHL